MNQKSIPFQFVFRIEAYSPHSVNELEEVAYCNFFQRFLHRMLISQKHSTKIMSHGKITLRCGDSHRIVYIKNRKLRLLICFNCV